MRLILSLLFLFIYSTSFSQTITLEPVIGGLTLPVDITHAGDERLFIVEKRGYIKILDGEGNLMDDEFLDIDPRVNSGASERGLLGLAFHPNYMENGYFFVNYINNAGNTVISRFEVSSDPDIADASSEKILMIMDQPFENHNGGDLNFGPDGYLYIGMGDGGSANDPFKLSQDLMEYMGKMLRIDVDNGEPYGIPADNPYANDDFGRDEIWAYGLRNPWRFSFDRLTGDMWIGDVGQNRWEEIDIQPRDSKGGDNYGWRCYEGDAVHLTDDCNLGGGFVFPVFVYANVQNGPGCSVTGGYVYRGNDNPHLWGKYIFADFCSGWFWTIEDDGCGNWIIKEDFRGPQFEYSTFGEDVDGELYVATYGQGAIYKIATSCELSVTSSFENTVCAEDEMGSITLEVSSNQNPVINWDNGESDSQLTDLTAGKYSVTVSDDSGCSYAHCFEILSIENMKSCKEGAFEDQYEACLGELVQIQACEAPEGFGYIWSLNGNDINDETEDKLTTDLPGKYQFRWTGPICNYKASDTIFVTIYDPGVVTISVNGSQLTATEGYVTYNWYLNGDLVGENHSNIFFAEGSGDYTVEAIDANGCITILSEFVTVNVNSIGELDKDLFKIFPNPFDDQFIIEIDGDIGHDLKIQLFSLDGREIFNKNIALGIGTIKFSTLQWDRGVYFVHFETAKFNGIRKLIKF